MSSPESKPRISLRDVAREVGVSVSAVSLAIRNHPGDPAPISEGF